MRAISKIDTNLDRPLGRYQLIALLGQGGMADVFLACTQGPGGFQKLLVVKLARFAGDPMLSMMFLDEARLAAQLSHPNVVQTFEVGEEGSRHYIVMEYLDGANFARLRQRAVATGGVPLQLSVHILGQVLEGLEYAHQAKGIDGKLLKVVHRDLTPSNIIVTMQGVVKILDFGIAKAADSHSFTQAGRFSGKLAYMPPEQVRGERVDERADIFSVGVILAEAALGVRYWGDASEPMIASRLVAGELPSLSRAPYLDPELRRICERALAPKREHRYPNVTAFKSDLQRFLQALGGPVPWVDMAEFVSTTTGEDRARLQAIVDSQLQHIGQLPSGSEPAPLDLPRVEVTPVNPGSLHFAPTVKRESYQFSAPRMDPPVPSSAPQMPVPAQRLTDHAQPTSNPGKRIALIAIVCGAAAAGGVAVALMKSTSSIDAPTAAQPGPAASASAALSPSPAPVRLEIVVSPPEATIRLDGQLLGANPYVGVFPHDGTIHDLLVTADGYEPINQRFSLERDLMLQFRLQAEKDEPSNSRSVRSPAAIRPSRSAARAPDREPLREPVPGPSPQPVQPLSVPPVTEPSPPAPHADAPAGNGKRSLDQDVFENKPNKRALDPNVFDESPTKAGIDRETPWKK
jgi:eukaryotic-like serine/threonine-protein kinase